MAERKSYKRDRILSLLQSVTCHPTAEWLYMELKNEIPSLSLATVYRNLEQLTLAGIIQKLEGENKTSHYDGNPLPHLHLNCNGCNGVFDIPYNNIEIPIEDIRKNSPFEVTEFTLNFRGYCPDCKLK